MRVPKIKETTSPNNQVPNHKRSKSKIPVKMKYKNGVQKLEPNNQVSIGAKQSKNHKIKTINVTFKYLR